MSPSTSAALVRNLVDPIRDFRAELTPASSILNDWSGVNFTLAGGKVVSFGEAVQDAVLKQTMTGASSLTIVLIDPDDRLLNSGLFEHAFDIPIHNGPAIVGQPDPNATFQWYRYVGISGSNGILTLTFEDRDVKYMRYHDEPFHTSRADHTRAEFIWMLVGSIKASPIQFVCPQLHRKQDVDSPSARRQTQSERERNRRPGLSSHDKVFVKGDPADAAQIALMNEVLDVGSDMGASDMVMLSALITVTQESGWDPDLRDYDTGVHVGLFQQDSRHDSYWYKAGGGRIGKRGVTGQAKIYFKTAMIAARNNPDLDEVGVAEKVQGIHYVRSPIRWLDEAKTILDDYGTGRVRESTYYKSFIYSTTNDGEPEDYWTAAKRLADEVQWALFMSNGVLYFMSETDLYNSPTRWTFNRRTKGVIDVSFSYDDGLDSQTITVIVNAEVGAFPVGSCVKATDLGRLSGKWIVSEWSRSLFSDQATLTLKKPTRPLPEPAPEAQTITSDTTVSQPSTDGKPSPTTDKLRDVTPRGQWAGTKAIFDQFVTPYMASRGLQPGSQKRATQTSFTGGTSDHWTGSLDAYAIDYPTYHGEGIARDLAKMIGEFDWQPNTFPHFNVKIGAHTYRFQILWGAEIRHGDHVHVGIKRVS